MLIGLRYDTERFSGILYTLRWRTVVLLRATQSWRDFLLGRSWAGEWTGESSFGYKREADSQIWVNGRRKNDKHFQKTERKQQ